MKAITIKSHWANAIATGYKRIEWRNWFTNYRGPILIHSARPEGAIVAIARLAACFSTNRNLKKLVRQPGWDNQRYAWVLKDIRAIYIPNIKGRQGLWEYEL